MEMQKISCIQIFDNQKKKNPKFLEKFKNYFLKKKFQQNKSISNQISNFGFHFLYLFAKNYFN